MIEKAEIVLTKKCVRYIIIIYCFLKGCVANEQSLQFLGRTFNASA